MPKDVVIREFGRLWSGESGNISKSAYDFLRIETLRGDAGATGCFTLSAMNGRECISVRNYVGVLSTPDGTVIEILPKHSSADANIEYSRKILLKMLSVVYGLTWKQGTEASLDTRSARLPDILVGRFLETVGQLVRRGLRSDYLRYKEQSKYLKGRLNVTQQIRLPPAKRTIFCVEYDIFSVNRPENRLIKRALGTILSWCISPLNKRLTKELLLSFSEVESSSDIEADFKSWKNRRDMIHYRPVHPWLELILNQLSPWTFSGRWHGISMLFPMEELFELYVYRVLSRRLTHGYHLKSQAQSEYLAFHKDRPLFQLRPDILVRKGAQNHCVMDTKWKLLDQSASDSGIKYKLNQADFYQMFAYGHKYLNSNGKVILIYPRHEHFQSALKPFILEPQLELWVLSYDLDSDDLYVPHELELPFFVADKNSKQVA